VPITREQLLQLIRQAQQTGRLSETGLAAERGMERIPGQGVVTKEEEEPAQAWWEKWNLLPAAGAVGGFMMGGPIGAGAGALAGEGLEQLATKRFSPKGLVGEAALGAVAPAVGGMAIKAAKPVLAPIARGAKGFLGGAGKMLGISPKELYESVFKFTPATQRAFKRTHPGKDILEELLDEGIKPADVGGIAEQIERSLSTKGNQLKGLLTTATKAGKTIPTKEVAAILDPVISELEKVALAGKAPILAAARSQRQAILNLGKTLTPVEAQSQKILMNNYFKNLENPALRQKIFNATRRGYKNAIEKAIGGDTVKTLNTRMSALMEAGDALDAAGVTRTGNLMQELFGIPSAAAFGGMAGGMVGGVPGAVVGGAGMGGLAVAQNIARATPQMAIGEANLLRGMGRGMAGLRAGIGGRMPQMPAGAGGRLGQAALGQPLARGVGGMMMPRQPEEEPPVEEGLAGGLGAAPTGIGLETALGGEMPEAPQPIISRENMVKAMMMDLEETGGKNIPELQAIYEIANEGTEQAQLELSDTAIENVTDLQAGLSDIESLYSTIESTGVVGPIAGLQVKLPWAAEAKTVQAEIDRVRQVVGKALEGGVLRKEDEEKYKKILPTISDLPEVARNKLKSLHTKLNQDLQRYIQTQQRYGKGRGALENLFGGPAQAQYDQTGGGGFSGLFR
jgi:hypothetical protein